MKKSYHPPQEILEKYANVLVNFALNGGKGIKKGDVVMVQAMESAKPLYAAVLRVVWKAGGHAVARYYPSVDEQHNIDRDFFEIAESHQLDFFPEKFLKGVVDQADHSILILAETNPHALRDVDPEKIMRRNIAHKPYSDWRRTKENAGKFSWTLALYGTNAMAKEASLSLEEYWKQITKACFLDFKNPVSEWKKVFRNIETYRQKLNKLKIEKVHVEGKDADLWIKIGDNRQWKGGGGANIPSFEIFTSPDWRGTEGWIRFNQPLYRFGNLIEGVELHFKGGKVVKATAKKNELLLKKMIASPNADKVGEFSLTDRRFSHITKFMAETLYDENIGGPEGNTHIALGAAYLDCYDGNLSKFSVAQTKKLAKNLGFNDSSIHTDIVSTTPRTVTAYLPDGTHHVIYKEGQFIL